jgi:hypothetical protein
VTRKVRRDKSRGEGAGFKGDKHEDRDSGQIIGQAIGRRLRNYYDHIVAQPVPDRFIELLKRLEEREAGKKTR